MTGIIYLVACEPLNAVKFGFTGRNIKSRLANLQTGCPVELQLLAITEGTLEEEAIIHRYLQKERTIGEWFRFHGKTQEFVDELLDGYGEGSDLFFDTRLQGRPCLEDFCLSFIQNEIIDRCDFIDTLHKFELMEFA